MSKCPGITLVISIQIVILLLLVACEQTNNNKTVAKSGNPGVINTQPSQTAQTTGTDSPAVISQAEPAATNVGAVDSTSTPDNSKVPDIDPGDSTGSQNAANTTTSNLPPSNHDKMLALAKKSGCLTCHSVDKKIVGPAWKDVAARYRDDNSARSRLIDKVSKGGKGNWTEVTGGVPMPPYHPRVSTENIEHLVDFVLSL
ncbi:c-type cytochrome [Kaarinaea lacus]